MSKTATARKGALSPAAAKFAAVFAAARALGENARLSDLARAARTDAAAILEGLSEDLAAGFTADWADKTAKKVDATIRAIVGAQASAKKGAPTALRAGTVDRLIVEAALHGYTGGKPEFLIGHYRVAAGLDAKTGKPAETADEAKKAAKTAIDTVSKGVRRAIKGLTPKDEAEKVFKPIELAAALAARIVDETGLTLNRALVEQVIAALSQPLEQALIDNAAVAEAQASMGTALA